MHDRCRARFFSEPKHRPGDAVEDAFPCCWLKAVAVSDQWRRQSMWRILPFQESTGSMAEKSFRNGMIGISGESDDAIVFDRDDDTAGISAIAITGRLDGK